MAARLRKARYPDEYTPAMRWHVVRSVYRIFQRALPSVGVSSLPDSFLLTSLASNRNPLFTIETSAASNTRARGSGDLLDIIFEAGACALALYAPPATGVQRTDAGPGGVD